jgi:hypothetical protein
MANFRTETMTALWILLAVLFASQANALSIEHKHKRVHVHRSDTRAFPPSKASLLAQNAAIDELGLHRYRNDDDLRAAVVRGDLMLVEETAGLRIRIPVDRRYLRPDASATAYLLSYQFWLRFDSPLYMTSAVRTRRFQLHLRRWNHNAAPVQGPLESSHLTGSTFDIARKKMTREQNRWMESYLYSLGDAVIVEEENVQACWHIFTRS